MSEAYSIAVLVVGVLGLCGIGWAIRGRDPRRDEDDARAFFDEYGRWPDQTEQEAAAEQRAPTAAFVLAEPDEHGNV